MKKVIAFACALLAVCVYIVCNTYTLHSYFDETGDVIPANTIKEVLEEEQISKASSISLLSVDRKNAIYQQGSEYYIGDHKKTKVDLNFPMLIKGGQGLKFLVNQSQLVDASYGVNPTSEGMIVIGGYSFSAEGEKAQDEKILLAYLQNGLYMNHMGIQVDTLLEHIELPMHSIETFTESYINTYLYQDGSYTYKAIRGLQNATITINGETMKYEDFLKKLSIIKEEAKANEKKQEEVEKKIEAKKEEAKKEDTKKNETKKDEKKDKDKADTVKTPNKTNPDNNDKQKPGEDEPDPTPKPSKPIVKPSKPSKPNEGGSTGGSGDQEGEGKPSDKPGEGNGGEGGGEGEGDSDDDDNEDTDLPDDTYIKPTVTVGELQPWVYTVHTNLTIQDPMNKIIRGVRFHIYDESGTLLMRKQVGKSGLAEISVLPPHATLYIEGVFQYYDATGKKVEETFYELTQVTTKSIEDNVTPLSFTYDQKDILSSTMMRLSNLQLKNDSAYNPEETSLENFYLNTLPYVNKGTIYFTDIATNEEVQADIGADTIKRLVKGEVIDFNTSAVLTSNHQYQYVIQLYDRFGNTLPTTPKQLSGSIRSAKQSPALTIKINENKAGTFKVNLTLSDIDEAITDQQYQVEVLQENGEALNLVYELDGVQQEGKKIALSSKDVEKELMITNLPFSQKLNIRAKANVDLQDNAGEANKEIGNVNFYSASIGNGSLNYTTSFTEVLGTSATIHVELNQKSTISLASLMNEVTITLKSDASQDITIDMNQALFNNINIEEAYQDDKKELLIQKGDKDHPEISLAIDKAIVTTDGITPWDAFCNGAVYGSASGKAGVLLIRLQQGSLVPSTKYTMSLSSKANQGGYLYDLLSYISKDNFTTKKREPLVSYQDYFQSTNFLEFYGIQVEDLDTTITNGAYQIQLMQGEELIEAHTYQVKDKLEKVRFTCPDVTKEYELRFVALKYNDGQTSGTAQSNFVFQRYDFKPNNGVVGSITLDDMQYMYEHNDLMSGNLDKDTLLLNKGYADGYVISDKEGYFLTPLLSVDPSKALIIYQFGSRKAITAVLYDKDLRVIGRYNNNGNYLRFLSILHGINTGTAYIQIEGEMKCIDKAVFLNTIEQPTDNLVKEDDIIKDATIDGNGNEVYSATRKVTGFIPVVAGDFYSSSNGTIEPFYYDVNKKPLYITPFNGRYSFRVIPEGVAYLRCSFPSTTVIANEYLYRMTGIDRTDGYMLQLHEVLHDPSGLMKENDTFTITQYKADDIDTLHYQQINKIENKVTFEDGKFIPYNTIRKLTLETNKAYKFVLSIRYHGYDIILDETQISTDHLTHIVKDASDLKMLEMDPAGTYKVVNDIELDENNGFPSLYLYGTVDFQGHTLTFKEGYYSPGTAYISKTGTLKNVRIAGAIKSNMPFINTNTGTIENIVYAPNATGQSVRYEPLMRANNGTITNFIIELDGENWTEPNTAGTSALLVGSNRGIIQNGYLYNKVKNGHVYIKDIGGFIATNNYSDGIIKNIYILSDVYTGLANSGSIVGGNDRGRIENTLVVGDRYKYTMDAGRPLDGGYNTDIDPTIGITTIQNNTNRYLVSQVKQYTTMHSTYATKQQLWDTNWYQDKLNKEKMFAVDDLVSVGYYPHLLWDASMDQYQPYIKLSEITPPAAPQIVNHTVTKQTEEYAEITLKLENPDHDVITKIDIANLDCTIYEQQEKQDYYEVTIRVSNPKSYVSSYQVQQLTYRSATIDYTAKVKDFFVNAEFYKPINSFNDWMIMASDATQNYRLYTDLDFSKVSNFASIYVERVNGKLDGGIYDSDGNIIGMHTLSNIKPPNTYTKGGALIGYVTGELKNMRIEEFEWTVESTSVFQALIYSISGVVNNVHMRDVEITNANANVAALCVRSESYGIIENCSVKDVVFTMNGETKQNYLNAGGIVATAVGGEIRNCYITDFLLDSSNAPNTLTTTSGGIVGNLGWPQTYIKDCYAVGKIKGQSYIGGICGGISQTARIERCYSNVAIEAGNEYVAGIVSTRVVVNNCLSLGDFLLSKTDYTYSHRIAAQGFITSMNNYAYQNQLFNNVNIGDDDATLVSREDLMNKDTYQYKIKMGDAFDYTNVAKGELPKIKSTSGVLLPDQDAQYLVNDNLSVKVVSASQSKETYRVELEIKHAGYRISDIAIEGMSDLSIKKTTKGDTTICEVTSKKLKAFDNYKVGVTLVDQTNADRTADLRTTIDYDGPVYWEVSNVQEWQTLMKSHSATSENFKITGILDFNNITNPALDVIANRLIGLDTKTSVIRNLSFTDTQGVSLIRSCLTSVSDLTFENITITYKERTSYIYSVGVIGINRDLKNCIFKNNSITYGNGYSRIGMVGTNQGNIENVSVSDMTIKGTNKAATDVFVGSVAGICNGHIANVTGDNITIQATNGRYIGSLLGQLSVTYINAKKVENLSITNAHIKGYLAVGGILGTSNSTIYNLKIKDSDAVAADAYAGGLVGSGNYTIQNNDVVGNSVENVIVKAETYAGGIAGYVGTSINYAKVENVTVTATTKLAGGIAGMGNINSCEVKKSKIHAKYSAGGLVGRTTNSIYASTVVQSEVTAESYVGGVQGGVFDVDAIGNATVVNMGSIQLSKNGVYDTKIHAENDYAAGVSPTIWLTTLNEGNVIVRSDIQAENYAGGLYGKVYGMDFRVGSVYNIVRNSSVTANQQYAGGYAGCVDAISTYYQNGGYIADVKIHAGSYAGGLYGKVTRTQDVTPTYLARAYLLYHLTITTDDQTTGDMIGIGYREVFGDSNFYAMKIEDSSTINGSNVRDCNIWQDENKEHVEIIQEKDIGDYDLLTNVNMPITGPTKNTKRPGLAWGKNIFSIYATSDLSKDNTAEVGLKNDFIFTPIDYGNQLVRIHADVPDGTYDVYPSNVPSVISKAVFKDQTAEVVVSRMSSANVAGITLKLRIDADTVWSSRIAYNGYATNAKILEGKTYYRGNDVAPQTIRLEDGDYTWYRSVVPVYEYNNQTYMEMVGTGNTLRLTSRGYYYAIDRNSQKVSPIITYDTYGYLPSLTGVPYQEGLLVEGDYSSAYPSDDHLYEGEIKLAYQPKYEKQITKQTRSTSSDLTTLPEVKMYASGVDTLNLEFDKTMDAYQKKGLQVSISYGKVKKEYTLHSRTMTIGYDFKTDLTVSIGNGSQTKQYVVHAKDVAQSISIYQNEYYYLVDTGVKSKEKAWDGSYVHLYQDMVLDGNNLVAKVSDGSTREATPLAQQVETIPLHQYDDVVAYASYATSEDTTIEHQLLMKNGSLHVLDSSLPRKGVQTIVDEYATHQLQCVLQDNGKLLTIMGDMKVPDDFRNENIVEITDTSDSTLHVVLIRYENGSLVGFNYINGESIVLEGRSVETNSNVFTFLKSSFLSMFDAPMESIEQESGEVESFEDALSSLDEEDLAVLEEAQVQLSKEEQKEPATLSEAEKAEAYQKAKAQKETIRKAKQGYVTMYDVEKKQYQTYQKTTLLHTEDEQLISENEKLAKADNISSKGKLLAKEQPVAKAIQEDNTWKITMILGVFVVIGGLLLHLKRKKKRLV